MWLTYNPNVADMANLVLNKNNLYPDVTYIKHDMLNLACDADVANIQP